MRKNRKRKDRKRELVRRTFKKKPCRLCMSKIKFIDHKNVDTLRAFISDRAKILPRRMSGNCAKHQRRLTKAIKKARQLGLIPVTL